MSREWFAVDGTEGLGPVICADRDDAADMCKTFPQDKIIKVREVDPNEIRPNCTEVHREDTRVITDQHIEMQHLRRALEKAKSHLWFLYSQNMGLDEKAKKFIEGAQKEIEVIEKGET